MRAEKERERSCTSERRIIGAMLTSVAVRSAAPNVKAMLAPDVSTSPIPGSPIGARAARAPRESQASHTPTTAPRKDNTRASHITSRDSAAREAPSACRIANARSRARTRASSKLATLAVATRSTSTTAADKQHQGGGRVPIDECVERRHDDVTASGRKYSCASRPTMPLSSLFATSKELSGCEASDNRRRHRGRGACARRNRSRPRSPRAAAGRAPMPSEPSGN